MCFPEKVYQKINLQQRLSTADRYSAFPAPIAAEAFCFVQKLVCGLQVVGIRIPGIYIVTILTSHITSFEENKISDSRAIYCTEGF